MRVAFDLPLDPRHRLTPEALAQLAEAIVGTRIGVVTQGPPKKRGRAGEPTVGVITEARVVEDLVYVEADVEEEAMGVVGGFGIDAVGRKARDGDDWELGSILTAYVAAIRTDALPPNARPWRRLDQSTEEKDG